MKRRICHVCSGHPVDDVRVFHRECRSLAAAGYDVHLIARGTQSIPYTNGGVNIHPLPLAKNRAFRILRRRRIAKMAQSLKPDLFHVHEPELLGPVVSIAGDRPVIWDVHESYLDVLMERHWIPGQIRPLGRLLWDRRERSLLRKCAAVIAVTDAVAVRYRSLHGNVVVVANYPHLKDHDLATAAVRDGRTCVFTGGILPDRGLKQMLQALTILRKRGLIVPFVLASRGGPLLEELLKEAHEAGIGSQIEYLGFLPREETFKAQLRSSIGVVPNLPYGNNLRACPSKLIEFMAAGLPVIYSDLPSLREIIKDSGIGIAIDPRKPETIADAIEFLVRNPEAARQMGDAGKKAVAERLNWEKECRKMFALYSSILGVVPAANQTKAEGS